MKRSTLVLGSVLLVVGGTLVALLDPLGTREDAAPAGARPEPVPGAGVEADSEAQLVPPTAGTNDPDGQERLAVAPKPGESLALLRLIDAEGRAVSRALVHVLRGEELLALHASDEHGELSLDADGEQALVVARGGGHPLALWSVRLDVGEHELRYPEGARVSGRIVREDGTAVAELELRLEADEPMLPPEPIPPGAWKRLNVQPRHNKVLLLATSDDGSFDFTGLPQDFSGALLPPRGWRLRSASRGRVETFPAKLTLEAPADDLVLSVSAPASLRGRLVAAADGAPLPGASLSALVRAPDVDVPLIYRGTSDQEGRFALSGTAERIASLDLRLGGDVVQGLPLLALEGAAVPSDGELGDVTVSAAREIPFRLRTPEGEPIPGGRASAAGTRSDPTGRDGLGMLRWVPLSAQRLRAEAPRFVPVEVELTPVLPDPLEIVLRPACELAVRVLPPAGGDPSQFRVVLVREEGVAAAPVRSQADQRTHVDTWAFPPLDRMRAEPSTFLCAQPSGSDDVARFHALRLGVPIELEVRGITGTAVYHRRTLEPFTEGEQRRLEIGLDGDVVVFRGRILDAEGAPLEMATVQLGGQILGWTDADGAFLCFLADAEPGTLVLQHTDCSTLFLHDYVVPPGGREVEFRLQPARQVTIEVVDEAGQPVPQAEVWILQEGFTTNTHRVEGHRHVASSLTDRPFEIEVRVGGHRYVRQHTSDVPEARVVVPVHGSVLARVSATSTEGRAGYLTLILQPLDVESGDPLVQGRRCQPGGLALELSAVLPGRYEAWLSYEPSEDERAAGREEETSAAGEVLVEAARTTEVRLDLP